MNAEQTWPDDEIQILPPDEPRVRVFGFKCAKCDKRVGVYRLLSQDPPRTEQARAEIERTAQNFHDLHTCKARPRGR